MLYYIFYSFLLLITSLLLQVCSMLVFRAKSAKKKPADRAAFKVDLLEYICAFMKIFFVYLVICMQVKKCTSCLINWTCFTNTKDVVCQIADFDEQNVKLLMVIYDYQSSNVII